MLSGSQEVVGPSVTERLQSITSRAQSQLNDANSIRNRVYMTPPEEGSDKALSREPETIEEFLGRIEYVMSQIEITQEDILNRL